MIEAGLLLVVRSMLILAQPRRQYLLARQRQGGLFSPAFQRVLPPMRRPLSGVLPEPPRCTRQCQRQYARRCQPQLMQPYPQQCPRQQPSPLMLCSVVAANLTFPLLLLAMLLAVLQPWRTPSRQRLLTRSRSHGSAATVPRCAAWPCGQRQLAAANKSSLQRSSRPVVSCTPLGSCSARGAHRGLMILFQPYVPVCFSSAGLCITSAFQSALALMYFSHGRYVLLSFAPVRPPFHPPFARSVN